MKQFLFGFAIAWLVDLVFSGNLKTKKNPSSRLEYAYREIKSVIEPPLAKFYLDDIEKMYELPKGMKFKLHYFISPNNPSANVYFIRGDKYTYEIAKKIIELENRRNTLGQIRNKLREIKDDSFRERGLELYQGYKNEIDGKIMNEYNQFLKELKK